MIARLLLALISGPNHTQIIATHRTLCFTSKLHLFVYLHKKFTDLEHQ
uniref:Uncharacterized protein n=1 Tax=Arundo donax TaxID=35708 RepID=A0A0A9DTS5_ARUDO